MNLKTTNKKASSKIVPPPSFVKLAMKNMVRKGSQSLVHFGITAFGFLTFILIIAALGRPNIPN
tara:strand:+ start:1025 stop:1216 length:192 start_codon:yes stop_codon:yes gene_type:complete